MWREVKFSQIRPTEIRLGGHAVRPYVKGIKPTLGNRRGGSAQTWAAQVFPEVWLSIAIRVSPSTRRLKAGQVYANHPEACLVLFGYFHIPVDRMIGQERIAKGSPKIGETTGRQL